MATMTAGLRRTMTRLPEQPRRSVTWDRGMELADHKNVTIDTGLQAFFADPSKPVAAGHA
jgi:IS30 family transposase